MKNGNSVILKTTSREAHLLIDGVRIPYLQSYRIEQTVDDNLPRVEISFLAGEVSFGALAEIDRGFKDDEVCGDEYGGLSSNGRD